jgi:hypothetical protein
MMRAAVPPPSLLSLLFLLCQLLLHGPGAEAGSLRPAFVPALPRPPPPPASAVLPFGGGLLWGVGPTADPRRLGRRTAMSGRPVTRRLSGNGNDDDGGGGGGPNDDRPDEEGAFDVESARIQLETLLSMEDETEGGVGGDPVHQTIGSTMAYSGNATNPIPLKYTVWRILLALPIEDLQATAGSSDPGASALIEGILPPMPPLSAVDRRRREVEISLLGRLRGGDDVLPDLWDLWYSERGPENHLTLLQFDRVVSDPRAWKKCETYLVALLNGRLLLGEEPDRRSSNPTGIHFVEAANCLATLYYLQGFLEDSYKLCRVVLHLKPWHVGALSGIVKVCFALGRPDEARMWAQRRLPTVSSQSSSATSSSTTDGTSDNNKKGAAGGGSPSARERVVVPDFPRRIEWCDRAVADARAMLNKAERSTVERLGRPEEYYRRRRRSSSSSSSKGTAGTEKEATGEEEEDTAAWQ